MPDLRVMSFNVRYSNPEDGPNYWELRRDLAVERIRAFNPDLLGLQECQANVHKPFLSAALPEYGFVGVQRLGPGSAGTEISAILYRRAAFELLEERHLWLSDTPEIPGSLAWGSALPRTVEIARLRSAASGQELFFLNTHLDYIASAADAGARMIRAEIDRLSAGCELILTGDFNAGKNSAAYRSLLGAESARPLGDSLRAAGIQPGLPQEASFHGFGQSALQDIDWILVSSGLRVRAAGIDRAAQPPRYPSDHYPVWAVLEF